LSEGYAAMLRQELAVPFSAQTRRTERHSLVEGDDGI